MSLRIKYNSSYPQTFNLTLFERWPGTYINFPATFYIEFEDLTTNTKKSVVAVDYSDFPETFNTFTITTLISGTTSLNNVALDPGWTRYKVYTGTDQILQTNLLEMGQCYCYTDEEDTENQPVDTVYTDTKDKYVYKR